VSESAAIATGFRGNSSGLGGFYPSLRREDKVVAPRLGFKPLEFERFKTWIAQFFPKPEKLNRAAATHPVIDDGKRLFRVSIPGDVGQGDVVLIVPIQDCDGHTLNFDSGFAHRAGLWGGMTLNPSNSTGLAMANSPQLKHCLDGFMVQGANWFKDT
jgi:hypothetical protein